MNGLSAQDLPFAQLVKLATFAVHHNKFFNREFRE